MWGHRNRLDVRVGTEIDLVSVMGSKLTWFEVKLAFMYGIESNFIIASGSNLTCFLCGGQNRLRFSVGAENYLVLTYGSKLTSLGYAGRKSLGFSVSIELDFVFVWVVEIDLSSLWGIERWT